MQIDYTVAEIGDLPLVFELVRNAIAQMRRNGIDQWDDTYPTIEDFRRDITSKTLWIGKVKEDIAVLYTINSVQDEEYKTGNWTNENFKVLHRLCVNPLYQNKGIANVTIKKIEKDLSEQGYESIRLDMFPDNLYARRLYEKNGYRFAGLARWKKGIFHLMEKRI